MCARCSLHGRVHVVPQPTPLPVDHRRGLDTGHSDAAFHQGIATRPVPMPNSSCSAPFRTSRRLAVHRLQVVSAPRRLPADLPAGSTKQDVSANPLLDAFEMATAAGADMEGVRGQLVTRYGFAVPSDEALTAIERCSPRGVVELGAGTGYWAHLLQQRGIDVVAFDVEPAPSSQNTWFAGTQLWHPVHRGDHAVVDQHPVRTLLIVWPTKDEIWAATALERYHDAGGECIAYVGEGPGGRTGDDVFHALLGELTVCLQCEHGSTTSPCICRIEPRWSRSQTVALPHWPGYHDDLHIYVRRPQGTRPPRWRSRSSRARRR